MTKSKQKKRVRKLNTGNRHVDALYKAVIKYVESRGGTAVVIGDIALVQEDPFRKFNYGVMVRITGKKPNFPSPVQSGE